MAMTMNGEVQLAASREAVWAKLNDPEVLKVVMSHTPLGRLPGRLIQAPQ